MRDGGVAVVSMYTIKFDGVLIIFYIYLHKLSLSVSFNMNSTEFKVNKI